MPMTLYTNMAMTNTDNKYSNSLILPWC